MIPALFAADFDGTFAFSGKIHADDLRAVEQFRRLGGWFGICTGRDPGSLRAELAPYHFTPDFLILMNGARIEAGGQVLNEQVLPDWRGLLPLLREESWFFAVIGAEEAYLEQKQGLPPLSEGDQSYLDSLRQAYPPCGLPEGPVYQISCRAADDAAAAALAQRLSEGPLAAFPNYDYVDIVPRGVGKAAAVGIAAAHFDVPERRVFTAGDGRNDMEMLSRWHGFAMEHAEPCVQKAAGRTAASVAEALRLAEKEVFL